MYQDDRGEVASEQIVNGLLTEWRTGLGERAAALGGEDMERLKAAVNQAVLTARRAEMRRAAGIAFRAALVLDHPYWTSAAFYVSRALERFARDGARDGSAEPSPPRVVPDAA
ncbi:MAG TPA: hypothetical protein VNN07_15830 [Candidatus Tectomicrobia bacterium]|nr:hypothetical protein [Candidatus Tectomicrobia bacterium]